MRTKLTFLAVASVLSVTMAAQTPAPAPPAGQAAGAGAAAGQAAGRGAGRGGGAPQDPNPNGLHVYIRAGIKTHGEGQHDYPQLLADWSKILVAHGAAVQGGFDWPTPAQYAWTDVMVMYKGDLGYMTAEDKTNLETFVKKGGGLVSFHDALCGPEPEYFAALVGGAKKHGEVNYTLDGEIPYIVADKTDPIMAGVSDFSLADDESFYLMTWAKNPGIKVLANTKTAATPTAVQTGHAGEIVPQIWTYEHTMTGGTKPSRAFAWMQGHTYANFADPRVQPMLLRGIAWAGTHPVNELVDFKPPAGRGGRGGTR